MSGQALDPVPPGGDVSRGRLYLPPLAKIGVAGASGCAVVGFMVWSLLPGKPQGPVLENFNHDTGRPWVQPDVASPPPQPPGSSGQQAAKAEDAPPGETASAVHAMGFWQDAAVTASATEAARQAAEDAAKRRGGNGGGAGDEANPQRAGFDEAQAKAGVTARAIVGKPFNLHVLLARNTKIPCLPEQPLDSAVAGPIDCMVTADVRSADLSVTLIEAGSTISGEVVRGPALGSNRLGITFDEVRTLTGIPIYFSGAAGDSLGSPGAKGYVDEHLWQKLRGALLLTMVEIAGTVVSNETQQQPSLNLSVGASAGEGLAQQMLAHDIEIQPTFYQNQAQPITVIVRQDIPMDAAYRLVMRGGAP